jgi:hypothetical protein
MNLLRESWIVPSLTLEKRLLCHLR